MTDDEQDLLDEISAEYGMPDVTPEERRTTWGNRIQIPFRSGGKRYFLKQWPAYLESEEEILFSLAVQDLARQREIPIPLILTTRDGRRVFNWRRRRFSIQKFTGDAWDPAQPAQIINCAGMLGRYHRAVQNHRLTGRRWGVVPLSRHHLKMMASEVEAGPLPSSAGQQLQHILRELHDLLEITGVKLKQSGWPRLPLLPAHGDYHHFNCRFKGSDVVGVVDFDNTRPEPRLYDVAYALCTMIGLKWHSEAHPSHVWKNVNILTSQAVAAWLHAYRTHAPAFSEEEVRLLPLVCAAVWPEVLNGFVPCNSEEVEGCEAVIYFMRYLLEDVDWGLS